MAIEILPEPSIPVTTPFRPGLGFLTATPIIATASICLALVILSAILAPWLSPHDPLLLAPAQRLRPASAQFLLGTDGYGRDVLSRILYGGRISLLIGLGGAIFSVGMGLVIGIDGSGRVSIAMLVLNTGFGDRAGCRRGRSTD